MDDVHTYNVQFRRNPMDVNELVTLDLNGRGTVDSNGRGTMDLNGRAARAATIPRYVKH